MTFKEYLTSICLNNKIFYINSFCAGDFVNTHMRFGFNDDDDDTEFERNGELIETKDDYLLFGPGDDVPTFIDTAQQIELKENDPAVYVTDRNDIRIALTFYTAKPIDHPNVNFKIFPRLAKDYPCGEVELSSKMIDGN